MTKSETDTWQNNLVHVYSIHIMLFECIYILYRYYVFQREDKKGDKTEDNSDESTNVLDEKVCF